MSNTGLAGLDHDRTHLMRLFERRIPDNLRQELSTLLETTSRLVPKKPNAVPAAKEIPPHLWFAVSRQLPYYKISVNAKLTKSQMFSIYTQSLGRLGKCREDVFRLIDSLVEANIEFRQEPAPTNDKVRQQVVDQTRSELAKIARFPISVPVNIATAELAACEYGQVRVKLAESLDAAVDKFIEEFLAGLDQLVERSLVGVVKWAGSNTCQYHFFRRVILQKTAGTSTSVGPLRRRLDDDKPSDQRRWLQEVTEVTSGSHTHRLGRHEHHAIEAFETTIADSKVITPLQVQSLIAAMPEWLRRVVRVIDGTLIRERIVEMDLRTDAWEDRVTRDEPVFGCEPAVVIGKYVLAGWGPREIEQELQRRDKEAREHEHRKRRRASFLTRFAWLTAGLATQVAAFAMFQRAIHQPSAAALGSMLFCAGVPCWMAMFRAHARVKERILSGWQPFALTAALMMVSGAIDLFMLATGVRSVIPVALTALTAGIALLFVPPYVRKNREVEVTR